VVPDGPWAAGSEPATTNQRMEVTATLEALKALLSPAEATPLEVVSDSTYVVNCFKQRWWQGWLRRGWRNTAGKPVANRDLWEPLLQLALDGGYQVTFRWVKGHSGDRWNDAVDALALEAAQRVAGQVS